MIAGIIAGYLVFRNMKSVVSKQMILYFLARNIYAMGVHLQHVSLIPNSVKGFPILAGLCWGFAMFMYETRKESISGSLSNAMKFCFKDSDEDPESWKDFVPFYIPQFI